MCDKAIRENGEILKFVSNCYKNQEMCNEAIDNYPHALEFVPECYKTQMGTYPSTITFVPECLITQEISDKSVNRCYFVFDSILELKTQEVCDRVFSVISTSI